MEIKSLLVDHRISAQNALVEITFKEYIHIAKTILKNNEFQRKRVKSSSSVYSLLKQDIKVGCIIPPIVLAISEFKVKDGDNFTEIEKKIVKRSDKLLILDGLQRTNSIIDLERELLKSGDEEFLEKLYNAKLRLEIYFGINKLGILYRMLTLNTGQTPMSARHQIEILYSDLLDKDINGIRLLTEVENARPRKANEYNFKEIIEGFNSYLDRSELTIDRLDILDNIKSLEKLSKENQHTDLFEMYLKTFHKFIGKVTEITNGWEFNEATIEHKLNGAPFGRTAEKIFKKSQAMTGYGAGIGKLIDFSVIDSFEDIEKAIDEVKFTNEPEAGLNSIVVKLDKIRLYAKKIGNDQRLLFMHFFRELFDKKGDGYLNIDVAIEEAYNTYLRKTQ